MPGKQMIIWVVAALPFVSTLLGGWAVFRLRHRLHVVMAFAAGILVATALVDLLPEALDLIEGDSAAIIAGCAAIVGYLVYASVEAFIHEGSYEHGHDPSQSVAEPHDHAPRSTAQTTLSWLAPAGLIAHSTLDGVAIGLGFQAGAEVGLIVTLAVLVHDFADGLNIVTVAFAGGHGRVGAIVLLALDAVATIVGIAVSLLVPLVPSNLGILLAGFAGAFIAIGATHLLPEAQHFEQARVSPLVILTIAGASLVVVVRLALG
jgi:ZIP family zinc transporter